MALTSVSGDKTKEGEKQQQERAQYFELKRQHDELNEKMRFFIREGIIDLSEIEEALAFIKLRKEKGLKASLDFLTAVDDDLDTVYLSFNLAQV